VGRVRHFLGCAADSDARVEENTAFGAALYWRRMIAAGYDRWRAVRKDGASAHE
jgi:hypothetical protein